jgi:AcrR family transcriptional regulator
MRLRVVPRTPSERTWDGAELGERHRAVLREGLALIAERGYAGASLRELARRVGMQQPSLYHYFRSKEEMVEQILRVHGFGGVASFPPGTTLPDRVEDLPRALADLVTALWESTDWPIFVRFLFHLAIEQDRHGEQLRALFMDRVDALSQELLGPYVAQGQIDEREARWVTRMVLAALALPYIEQKILFRDRGMYADMKEYGDYVVRCAELALKARPDRPPADRRTRARGRPPGR